MAKIIIVIILASLRKRKIRIIWLDMVVLRISKYRLKEINNSKNIEDSLDKANL